MRAHPVLVAAAAVALAGGVAACGGSSTTAAPSHPAAVLTRAYSQTVAAKTADVTFSLKEQVAGRTITGSGSGAFDWGSRQGTLGLSFAIPGSIQSVRLQEVVADGAVYVKLPAQISEALGVSQPWIKVPVGSSSPLSSGPGQTLQLLISESNGVTRVGTATVDGVATTEYKATVDPTKTAQNLPSGLKSAFQRLTSSAKVSSMPVEVWVDSVGRAVRVVGTSTVTAPASASTGGSPQTVVTTDQFDFSRYGAPVSITVPPASQVGTSSQLDRIFG